MLFHRYHKFLFRIRFALPLYRQRDSPATTGYRILYFKVLFYFSHEIFRKNPFFSRSCDFFLMRIKNACCEHYFLFFPGAIIDLRYNVYARRCITHITCRDTCSPVIHRDFMREHKPHISIDARTGIPA